MLCCWVPPVEVCSWDGVELEGPFEPHSGPGCNGSCSQAFHELCVARHTRPICTPCPLTSLSSLDQPGLSLQSSGGERLSGKKRRSRAAAGKRAARRGVPA